MLSNFFLDRPIFAWVIAIIMMLAGGLAIYNLPSLSILRSRLPPSPLTPSIPGRRLKPWKTA